jgi:hypothetical protein
MSVLLFSVYGQEILMSTLFFCLILFGTLGSFRISWTLISIRKLWKKIKKIFQKFRNFGIFFFDARSIFFSKKNFNGNLPEAKGCRELDHTQYGAWTVWPINNISENWVNLSGKNNFNFGSGDSLRNSK